MLSAIRGPVQQQINQELNQQATKFGSRSGLVHNPGTKNSAQYKKLTSRTSEVLPKRKIKASPTEGFKSALDPPGQETLKSSTRIEKQSNRNSLRIRSPYSNESSQKLITQLTHQQKGGKKVKLSESPKSKVEEDGNAGNRGIRHNRIEQI